MARIIRATGAIVAVEPAAGPFFTLAELKEIVGGYIEIVRTRKPGELMVVNEDGHSLGLPFNSLASSYYEGWPPHPVLGDVLVCDSDQID